MSRRAGLKPKPDPEQEDDGSTYDGSTSSSLWFNGTRKSFSMGEGKDFSAYTLANAIHASMDDREGDIFSNFEEHLFNTISEGESQVSLSKFLGDLKWMGLRTDDPRLRETVQSFRKLRKSHYDVKKKDVMLDKETFCRCITNNLVLIKKAFEAEFIIPEFSKFCRPIDTIYENCMKLNTGVVSKHNEQLSRYDSNFWGVSLCTVDGQRYSLGDVKIPFALQSTFKPLNYALALDLCGPALVHKYVGREPSGEEYKSLKLDINNQPHNPMINSGGMVIISLIKSDAIIADRFDFINEEYKKMAGGEHISFNNCMYLSERESSNRNFALGHYLRENKCFPEAANLKDTLDLYFQLCSVEVTAESAAVIAATLANGGICPLTGEECVSVGSVQHVLSLMHSCGMYDYSGQFAFTVGLPAKASVSGSILLVIPNVMGMCIWAPPLDKDGNSEKGIAFCNELVKVFNFHQYDSLLNLVDKIDPRLTKKDKAMSELQQVISAAYNGNIKELTRMFLIGADMHAADYDGRTALHLACSEGHLNCVKFLLEKCHVPVAPTDRWDHSPLDEARSFGHSAVVDYLENYTRTHTVPPITKVYPPINNKTDTADTKVPAETPPMADTSTTNSATVSAVPLDNHIVSSTNSSSAVSSDTTVSLVNHHESSTTNSASVSTDSNCSDKNLVRANSVENMNGLSEDRLVSGTAHS